MVRQAHQQRTLRGFEIVLGISPFGAARDVQFVIEFPLSIPMPETSLPGETYRGPPKPNRLQRP